MRAFRFFFAFSFLMIVLFFVAKVFLLALAIGAIMSIVYFVVRKLRYAFSSRRHGEPHYETHAYRAEPLFESSPYEYPQYATRNRIIVIR